MQKHSRNTKFARAGTKGRGCMLDATSTADGVGYRHIDGKREHRVFWEETYGPIPEGHVIHHIDGNPSNNALDNLACLTNAEHVRLHSEQRRNAPEHIHELHRVHKTAAKNRDRIAAHLLKAYGDICAD